MSYYIRSEEDTKFEPKRFRPNGKLHYYVNVYLEPDIHDKDNFENIEFVQYELHPTFKERIVTSNNYRTNFGINIWTYGYFKAKARIRFKDGHMEEIEGFVNW